MGEFTKAVEHADNVLDLYDDEQHRHLAPSQQDPKTQLGSSRRFAPGYWATRTEHCGCMTKRTRTPAGVVTPSISELR